MEEKIYTIPVTDAFSEDGECPLCSLHNRFEEDNIGYFLGPALMQPENRIQTNDKGFCQRHFTMLLESKGNRLGLGLTIETYLETQLSRIDQLSRKPEDLVKYLKAHEHDCCMCEKLDYTMDRYVEVILQRWASDEDFRNKFNSCKGFCMHHFMMLLNGASNYLGRSVRKEFAAALINLEKKELLRTKEDIDWFTKKFDYRYKDEDWKSSKDALERSVGKITGFEKEN